MAFQRTGRIWLPKRWSRAKRKRHRAGVQWLRQIEPAYRRMLERLWSFDPPKLEWPTYTAKPGPIQFIDDPEFLWNP